MKAINNGQHFATRIAMFIFIKLTTVTELLGYGSNGIIKILYIAMEAILTLNRVF